MKLNFVQLKPLIEADFVKKNKFQVSFLVKKNGLGSYDCRVCLLTKKE